MINPPCCIGTQNKQEILERSTRVLHDKKNDCGSEANKIPMTIVLTVEP
jgi:hypothetical protein